MKIRTLVSAMSVAFFAQAAVAATVDLTGLGYVQYGDAQSYSMPIANYQYGFNTNNGPFAIPSSPGQISSLTVLGTGSGGNPVTENFAGMDNAYATPSGVGGEPYFYNNGFTYQGTQGLVANNLLNTWDVSLSALEAFLAGGEMAVFFNNNQEKSLGTAAESLATWARVWITDSGNNVVAGSTFEFTNNDKSYNLVSEGGGGVFGGDVTTFTAAGSGFADPTHAGADSTDFVLSGGTICVVTSPSLPGPVPETCGLSAADLLAKYGPNATLSAPIDHNLGADHVAYTLIFPELNDLLGTLFGLNDAPGTATFLDGYTMHADVRLGCDLKTATIVGTDNKGNPIYAYSNSAYGPSFSCLDASGNELLANGWGTGLNNGYEQFFIGTAITGVCPPTDPNCNPTVPEPGILWLVGASLFGMGLGLRRKV